MDLETQAYADALHNLWDQVRGAIQDLPTGALNWTPLQQDTSSAAIIVTHMCGVASMGVIQALTGVEVHRVRDSEFQATANNVDELLALIERTEGAALSALEQTDADALGEMAPATVRGPVPRRLGVLRSISHIGMHLGHLQLTRQLWYAQQ